MTGSWILLTIVFGGSAPTVTSASFADQAACNAAASKLEAMVAEYASQVFVHYAAKHICTPAQSEGQQ